MAEIVAGCDGLAVGLELWADYIVAEKAAALVQLGVMAAEFLADQAASIATAGLAEAAVPAIIAAGKAVVETLKQQIVQMILGKVVETAAKPLFAKVEQMLAGLDWSQAPADASASGGFSIDFAAAKGQVALLREHAETMRGHAQRLGSGLDGLTF